VAKPPSPLVGFNNNVKHLGRIFHVQTEDSGVNRPHIVTHLFVDGGRIIKSTRTDYSEHLGRPDMATVVRRLMKEQHKAMFIALRDGQLNDAIDTVIGPTTEGTGAEGRLSEPPGHAAKLRARPPSPTLPDIPVSEAPPPLEEPPASAASPAPVPRRPAPTLTDLVLADLEAARARVPAEPELSAAGRPAPKGSTPMLGTPSITSRPPSPGRYAASRPAAIFTNAPDQGSIFGGSSISEQSLDEVILSYLAEDLDGTADE
jgi:hypothetical protein